MNYDFSGLDWIDYGVIGIYFCGVLLTGLISSWKSKRDSVGGFFLASRQMHFIPVGASIFASNIGSGHFIGLAGTAATSGIGINAFELGAIFFIILLGWYFLPVYLSSGVYTMPEYLQKRFGGNRIRLYLSVLTLLLYIFTKISADLYAGAIFITVATQTAEKGDLAIYVSILILLLFACLFTVFGGLTAVIWTDFVQTILMIGGALALSIISLIKVGGYNALLTSFFESSPINSSLIDPSDISSGHCNDVPADSLHLFRSASPGASDLPWTGVLFGLSISSLWYWCSDQVIVQRVLSAKNVTHAKGGVILASYLKLLPLFLIILPGMASRVLFNEVISCSTPQTCTALCNSKNGCSNLAYIYLVIHLLPSGLRGLMMAVMLAALMSSLTSIFNSASTIFTMDIWAFFRPQANQRELLIVGRLFIGLMVGISILWIPIIQSSKDSQLFIYIQSITSFLAPPICAIYILAIFWGPTNEKGAFWGLCIGLLIGLIRFALEYSHSLPSCGDYESPMPPNWWRVLIRDFHFLNFGVLLWGISGLIAVVVSLCSSPEKERKELDGLTYWTRKDVTREDHIEIGGNPLEESSKWSLITEVNAYLVIGIASFFVGFYA